MEPVLVRGEASDMIYYCSGHINLLYSWKTKRGDFQRSFISNIMNLQIKYSKSEKTHKIKKEELLVKYLNHYDKTKYFYETTHFKIINNRQ